MKKIILLILCTILYSCSRNDEYNNSPAGNFNALWKIIDENYCFFDYKEIDWDQIYDEYKIQIDEDMDENSLFIILSAMVNELKDGHVNLFSGNQISAYDEWQRGDPFNFNFFTVKSYYLDNNYSFFDNAVYYKAIEKGKIGYIYYQSFTKSVLETELDLMFKRLNDCESLIIDIRDNGGGSLTNSDRLASRFFHRKTVTGYIQHKTGKGHNDFSSPYPIYLEPSHSMLWPKEKRVVVLTNRKCYSAANNFISKMNVLENITTIGTRSGGGNGFPFTSELPNGWGIRFSTSPILNINKQHTEFGIDPDITVEAIHQIKDQPLDPILEYAISYLK